MLCVRVCVRGEREREREIERVGMGGWDIESVCGGEKHHIEELKKLVAGARSLSERGVER